MQASAPPPSVSPDDGSAETAEWYAKHGPRTGAAMLEELHQTERVKTSCALCGETFEGPFRESRAWFAKHRAERHP